MAGDSFGRAGDVLEQLGDGEAEAGEDVFAVQVVARAANNTIVPSFNEQATLILLSGPAGVSGAPQAVTFSAGRATFGNLRVTQPGTYQFRIMAGNLFVDFTVSTRTGRLIA